MTIDEVIDALRDGTVVYGIQKWQHSWGVVYGPICGCKYSGSQNVFYDGRHSEVYIRTKLEVKTISMCDVFKDRNEAYNAAIFRSNEMKNDIVQTMEMDISRLEEEMNGND